jgi:hypothetical protein
LGLSLGARTPIHFAVAQPAPPAASDVVRSADLPSANGAATLLHVPVGTAQLSWNSSTQVLKLTVSMSGMAPGSAADVNINNGNCASLGGVVFKAAPITADQHGTVAPVTTDFFNVPAVKPNHAVVVATGANTSQATPVACGSIGGPPTSPYGASVTLNATAPLGAVPSVPNQNVSGTAQGTMDGSRLTIYLQVWHLQPNTQTAAAVYEGSCTWLNDVVYDLTPLTADSTGYAGATTVIANAQAVPSNGWYIGVVPGTNAHATTQMLACGNVQAI